MGAIELSALHVALKIEQLGKDQKDRFFWF